MKNLIPPINDKDHYQGRLNARVNLVTYCDYECPDCGMAYPVIKQVQEKFGDDLCFVFRNFPLTDIHPHAVHAALAAEAAAKQEKFWDMHDMLYENQDVLDDQALETYAEELELNLNIFNRDIESEDIQDLVENDYESGLKSGVNGTPTFFINGTGYSGNFDYSIISKAIIYQTEKTRGNKTR